MPGFEGPQCRDHIGRHANCLTVSMPQANVAELKRTEGPLVASRAVAG